MENKVKKSKNGLKIVLVIIGGILLAFAFFISQDLKQEKILRETIDNYIANQVLPSEATTTGEYYKIEKNILEYLQNTNKYTEELTKVFYDIYDYEFYSVDNVSKSINDDFKSDKEKLAKYEDELNTKLNQFIELNNYDELLKKLNTEDSYYKDLYVELLGNKDGFNEANAKYEEFKTLYKEYFKVANKYIDFLEDSTVKVDEKENLIMFIKDSEIAEYDKISTELNEYLANIVARQ